MSHIVTSHHKLSSNSSVGITDMTCQINTVTHSPLSRWFGLGVTGSDTVHSEIIHTCDTPYFSISQADLNLTSATFRVLFCHSYWFGYLWRCDYLTGSLCTTRDVWGQSVSISSFTNVRSCRWNLKFCWPHVEASNKPQNRWLFVGSKKCMSQTSPKWCRWLRCITCEFCRCMSP